MHGIVPAGCELICEYFDVDPVAFFSWDNIFASTDEFVESLGEARRAPREAATPALSDFSKHEESVLATATRPGMIILGRGIKKSFPGDAKYLFGTGIIK